MQGSRMHKGKGLFISFEGGDGAGKSTQLKKIREYMEERGLETVFTREPGGTPIGEKIRNVILDVDNREMTDYTESYLYAASRAQVVREVIRPALMEGKVVVCDRFVDSSIAYQGYGRGLGRETVWNINKDAVGDCMPDLTIFLDIDPGKADRRMGSRTERRDRLEVAGVDFHQKVYDGYMEMIASQEGDNPRIVAVPADLPPDEVWENIKTLLDKKLETVEL